MALLVEATGGAAQGNRGPRRPLEQAGSYRETSPSISVAMKVAVVGTLS